MKKVKKYKYIIVIIIITLMMIFKIGSVSQAKYKGQIVENSRISITEAKKYKK